MSDNNFNFINFHILISHSPSNLNRDDMGMQKTAIFGGVKRARISSQSLKRAIRKSEYYKQYFSESSIRTKQLGQFVEKIKEELKDKYNEQIIQLAIEWLSGQNENSQESKALIAWVKSEIEFICEKIKSMNITEEEISKEKKKKDNSEKSDEELKALIYKNKIEKELNLGVKKNIDKNSITKEEILKEKKKKGNNKKTDKELKALIYKNKIEKKLNLGEQLKQAISTATDIALSGRMITSGTMTSVDGALAVAHAITTHNVDSEIDWFTAVDDLKQEEGSEDKGSAHLDTTEFSSGVFYRYASLNLSQLQENLGDKNNRSEALKIASHVLHLLTTVTPSAKQQAFAAHNLADFALVTFSDQPLSLANAFEIPVKNKSGLLKPSIDALLEYQKQVIETYGLTDDPKAFYSVQPIPEKTNNNDLKDSIQGLTDHKNLEDLKEWICKDGPIQKKDK